MEIKKSKTPGWIYVVVGILILLVIFYYFGKAKNATLPLEEQIRIDELCKKHCEPVTNFLIDKENNEDYERMKEIADGCLNECFENNSKKYWESQSAKGKP